MNIHQELRKKLDHINTMDRVDASKIVTEILKYLMDSMQPERSKREDLVDALQDELMARHKLSIEIVKSQSRCGALNTMET